jgi:hypothetical protein
MCIKTNRLNERCRIVLLFFSFVVFFQFSKIGFSWYSRGESIVFKLGYNGYYSLGRFHHSPTARVGIFILLNNSHHYTLVEECTMRR